MAFVIAATHKHTVNYVCVCVFGHPIARLETDVTNQHGQNSTEQRRTANQHTLNTMDGTLARYVFNVSALRFPPIPFHAFSFEVLHITLE